MAAYIPVSPTIQHDVTVDQPEGVSWESLAASEAANLHFPGSTLEGEEHHDEGEGWGWENTSLSAMLLRRYAVFAEPDELMKWWHEQLTARGWTPRQSHPFEPGKSAFSAFSRENAQFMLRVFGTGATRAWWTYWRKAWNDGRLYYDITLTAD